MKMPKINITDGYFNRLTKDQLKDFMNFVLFSNVAGLQYESALFKALLFKLELPPLEVTVTEEQAQSEEREVKPASEVKKEKEQEKEKGEKDESKGEEDK
jgi:hypothetical protein